MNSFQVLPCPKCGSDEIAYGHGGPPWSAFVECHNDDCRAIVLDYQSESRAIIRWNKGLWDGVVTVDDDGFNVLNKVAGFKPRDERDEVG